MIPQHDDRRLLEGPFHARLAAACETHEWYGWKGVRAVRQFTTVAQEYFAIRNAAGLFDLTPLIKYRISGPDSLPYLNRLVTRELGQVDPGRAVYCVWCNDEGQVLDDGTLFHLRPNEWRLCSAERHLDWLLWSAVGFDVQVSEETGKVAALALQGPTSCSVLRQMGLTGIERLAPFRLQHYSCGGLELMVSRTGFTGDLGYELWCDTGGALALWDQLVGAGANRGLLPVGAAALDIARIEAGFIQAGVDFLPADHAVDHARSRTPLELGLEWLVDFRKPAFNGRAALLEGKRRGPRYRLVRLDVEGNKPARDSFIYTRTGRVAGTVTSAVWSPSAKANIAIASLVWPLGNPGDFLRAEVYFNRELQWHRRMARCRVVAGRFFDPPRRNAVPAADF